MFYLLLSCQNDSSLKTFNTPPTVNIISHEEGQEVIEGDGIQLIAVPSDPNHKTRELEVEWRLNGAVICEKEPTDTTGLSTCEVVILEEAEIQATVYDPENATGEDRVVLDVSPSQNPTIEILSPLSNTQYYSDELILFSALLFDNEDQASELIFYWSSTIEGDIEVGDAIDSAGVISDFNTLSEGEHGLSLTVTDSNSNSTIATTQITVGPPNSPPSCSILYPEEGELIRQNTSVFLESLVDDIDIGPEALTVLWSSDKEGVLCSDTANSSGAQRCESNFLEAGLHELELRVEDEKGLSCTATQDINVVSPPSLSVLSPTPSQIINDDSPVIIELLVSDVEDSPEDLTVRAVDSVEGVITMPTANSQGGLYLQDIGWSLGSHSLTIEVEDTDGLQSNQIILLTVNGLPSSPTLEILPVSPKTGDTIQVLVTDSIDPEQDTISYDFLWSKDGVLTSYTLDTIPSSATNKDELWTVSVVPRDPYGSGPESLVSTNINNTPPQISTVNISPSSQVTSLSTLSCAPSVTDADNDTLSTSYQWLDSNLTLLGSASSLQLSPLIVQPQDTISCEVSVSDNDGGFSTNSSSVTIINTHPSILDLSISPEPATTENTLNALVLTEDLDNQIVSLLYDWSVNGVTQSNSLMLNHVNTQRGDLISLSVTPDDGLDMGASQSISLSVENAISTAPQLSLIPEFPVEGLDNLLCDIQLDSQDADQDPITYTFEWFVDGQSTSHSTNTVQASNTLAGEVWECRVTPNDGIEDGQFATIDVTIRSDCSSLILDGSDDGLIIAEQDNLLGITTNFSISAWVNIDSNNNQSTISIFDGESTNSSNPIKNSGYGLRVLDGQLNLFVGTGNLSNSWWSSGFPLPTDQWVHVSGTRNSNLLSLYVNGQPIKTFNTAPTNPIEFYGDTYDHNRYQIGLLDPNGLNGPHFEFHGQIRNVGVWARAISDAEVLLLSSTDFEQSIVGLVGHWPIDEGQGQNSLETTSGLDAYFVGDPSWIESCPFEDADNDGYAASLDCDDTDPTIHEPDGSSANCAAISCKWIENSGFAQGNGIYWLDPDGTSAEEAYCDMSTDGGGWTLILKAVFDNFDYDDPIWTTDATLSPTDFQLNAQGLSKYPTFNSVPFTEIRSSDPSAFSNDFTHQFSLTYSSALELFSGSGIPINNGLNAYFNSISNPTNQIFGCSQYQRFGFNQMDYLGLNDIDDGITCNWNGGARWGQRVNGNHNGEGNHSGQGWGAYSSICQPWRAGQSNDPNGSSNSLCFQGIFEISQLLWVR